MLVWFIYDIVKDRSRKKLADKAIEQGLYRVQKSVFAGNIDNNLLDELVIYSEDMINPTSDSVYIFPMCQEDFKKIELLGQAFDKAMVNDELKSLFT
ncbi:CRISPR-associated endonuclease Cas2 [Halanaerobium salsuginis]|jgi:CRISPR-associated protein Cas2|uniref:CRISPR-associated endoribonuclease Cas2 n=1 Tax=Halanaerobium salsuginis TaxID=29563 RepID=A0A1I4M1W4_9FIRM|nr:CRISPR-associated endonuclease Cas2 [Halanaerobium salsuginis]SFL97241.1 CRISPR-associated protein, Cas2 family [Halanaerobium salsuginis]